MSDDETEAYAVARSGVRPGAEASDAEDDELFAGTAQFSMTASQ